jgi:hypothetical protein
LLFKVELMAHAAYLRQMADRCISTARNSYGLATARERRLIAAELLARANEVEKQK